MLYALRRCLGFCLVHCQCNCMAVVRKSYFVHVIIISFKHTGTPVLFVDDPGELASDEERCSAMNTGDGVLTKQVDELCQVVSYRMVGNFHGKSEKVLKINFCGFKFHGSNRHSAVPL